MKYNNKKYKVVNAKVNKQLINDELEFEPIRSKDPSILQQILDRLNKQDEFNRKIEAKFEQYDAMFKEHGWIK